ncbi:bifunctional GNAT family N-acetyltransferase/acetate--CoA ligase family protein [Mariniluteicoccus endophyticus]
MTSDDDAAADPAYPQEWEADVLLSDGSAAHLRPMLPTDDELLVAFYSRVSPESKYLRFFAPYPVLSDADVRRFTHVDHCDRVALILTVAGNMVAVGRYDRISDSDAEVAFLVEDSVQGKGVGQLLLEHLAEAGRERGVQRFVAEILPQNRRMAQVFVDAGYTVHRGYEDGMIMVEFPISPTQKSVEVMQRREHRAEANSVRRLLHPERLAVVAPADRAGQLARSLLDGGFTGSVVVVCTDDGHVDGVPALALADLGETNPVDIVVTSLAHHELGPVIERAEAAGAFGLYVLHAGEFGGEQNRAVVAQVRAAGLRALGPDALGIINTATGLNASPAPMPRRGGIGMFCQSSGVAVILLSTAIDQNLGLASFISSGLFADVTANDVMQYWMDDDATRLCLLSLDRIGNPRKFTRIARTLASRKPVVLFSPGRSERESRHGAARGLALAGERAVDAMFRQSGIIVCSRRDAMYDVAQILARQPLPAGDRVRVITNSPALYGHIKRVGRRNGLVCDEVVLPLSAPAEAYAKAARAALTDGGVDSVVVCVVDIFSSTADATHDALTEVAHDATKPVLGVFADFVRVAADDHDDDVEGGLPTYSSYADAISALGQVTEYARWRETDHGTVAEIDVDAAAATGVIEGVLEASPEGRTLTAAEARALLDAYGIEVVPRTHVTTVDEAIAAAAAVAGDVVLKATDPAVRGLPDAPSVFRHLQTDTEVFEAWCDLGLLVEQLGLDVPDGVEPQRLAAPVVQAMAPTGVALTVGSREDAGFGPIISIGLAGLASDLLDDVSHRVPPLTTADAACMIDELRAAPTLAGHDGAPGADRAAIEELLGRVARLADDHPQLAEVTLTPCIASAQGLAVVGATVRVSPSTDQRDAQSRSLE